jgi:hypothetical protein
MYQPGSIVILSDFAQAMSGSGPVCTVQIDRVVHAAPGYGVFYFTKEGNYILILPDVEGKDRVVFMVKPEQVEKIKGLEKTKTALEYGMSFHDALTEFFNFKEDDK